MPSRDAQLKQIRLRISDPGAFLPRGDDYTESIPSWSARAVMVYVDALQAHVCPTPCDADCDAKCHETHKPSVDWTHGPEDCPSRRDPVYRWTTSTLCPGCGQNRQVTTDGEFTPHRRNHDGTTGPVCTQKPTGPRTPRPPGLYA